MSGANRSPREVARSVIEIESLAIRGLLDQLDDSFDRAVEAIVSIRGRVVCTGMGKSGLILKKVAATLASTGTPSLFLHPAEAIHGDVGMITRDDVVLAASYSGTTEELIRLVEIVQRLGVPLIVMTGNSDSPLARHADVHLRTEIDQEACPLNLAPTASTSVTLALGDALAMALLEARGFTTEDFARLHPGGRLGKRLLEVKELMHHGDALPRVEHDADLRAAIVEISGKGLGIHGGGRRRRASSGLPFGRRPAASVGTRRTGLPWPEQSARSAGGAGDDGTSKDAAGHRTGASSPSANGGESHHDPLRGG